jgi:hypothetical protein
MCIYYQLNLKSFLTQRTILVLIAWNITVFGETEDLSLFLSLHLLCPYNTIQKYYTKRPHNLLIIVQICNRQFITPLKVYMSSLCASTTILF